MKALEQLAQQGKIKEKMYGKQKIYFADQVREVPANCRLYPPPPAPAPCKPNLEESARSMNSLWEN